VCFFDRFIRLIGYSSFVPSLTWILVFCFRLPLYSLCSPLFLTCGKSPPLCLLYIFLMTWSRCGCFASHFSLPFVIILIVYIPLFFSITWSLCTLSHTPSCPYFVIVVCCHVTCPLSMSANRPCELLGSWSVVKQIR
jgi:hypothetical protein